MADARSPFCTAFSIGPAISLVSSHGNTEGLHQQCISLLPQVTVIQLTFCMRVGGSHAAMTLQLGHPNYTLVLWHIRRTGLTCKFEITLRNSHFGPAAIYSLKTLAVSSPVTLVCSQCHNTQDHDVKFTIE
jgi:hypothetical protein